MSNEFIPLLIFFLAFFLAFSVIELLIIFTLNRFGKRHWEFVVDKLIRAKVRHGRAIEMIAAAGVLIVLAFIWFLTPLFEVLGSAKPTLKTFSLVLIVLMIVIYFVATHKTTKMALEKKIHRYIYFIISIILFSFIIIMADQSYNTYQNYIQSQFIRPTTQAVKTTIEKHEENRLLAKFKEDYLAGRCESIDYTEEDGMGLKHFVYVTTDLELASKPAFPHEEDMSFLKGHKCSDGKNTFLLNEEGRWYWVISE